MTQAGNIVFKKACSILLSNCLIIFKLTGNNPPDSLQTTKTCCIKPLFTVGYRIPVNANMIINSGHGIYIEGGVNTGGLISKKIVLGIYGGFAFQDRFWSTSFRNDFSNAYAEAINKDQINSGLDSAIINSSADLFKNKKGSAITLPGCETRSFHNYSWYYGFVLHLPFQYFSFLKIYTGTTRSHFQGDGNIATKQKEFNIFELRRSMYGCELGIFNVNKNSLHLTKEKTSKFKNRIGLSIYYEWCDLYNSSLYFSDGNTTRKIPIRSYTTNSFLSKYKKEAAWGLKLFFYLK